MKSKHKISIFSLLIAVLICLFPASSCISHTAARENGFGVITRVKKVSSGGYTEEIYIDEQGNPIKMPPSVGKSICRGTAGALPTAFDSRDCGAVTAVKNQGESSCCWAFAAMGAVESSMIKKGHADLNSADYSESHLIWFANNQRTSDTSDTTYGDGEDFESPFDRGGSWFDATYVLARGSGAELETNKPFYGRRQDFGLMSCGESDRYVSYARLTDTDILAQRNEDISDETVKSAIMDGGSVVGSYFNNAARYCYGIGYTSYYQSTESTTNHAVLIVGWDDGYSAAQFNSACSPPGDGAWLCKNSWGESWGDDGYFWLSYHEPSLKNIARYTAAAPDKFDNIYQYDGAGWGQAIFVSGFSTAKTANIFTSSKDELLTHVAFSTSINTPVRYEINIYINVKGATDPTKGTKVVSATTSGVADFMGFHTAELSEPVELTGGQRFSAVIMMTDETGENMSVPVEGNSSVYSSAAGVSFFGAGSTWYDTSQSGFNNTCVKVMTRDYHEEITISSAEGGGIVIDDENGYIYGIEPGTAFGALSSLITVSGGHIELGDGVTVGTGVELNVISDNDGSVFCTYILVIFGDINGDGYISATDLTLLKAHLSGQNPIAANSAHGFAIDLNRDGVITQTDYTLLNSVINALASIDQSTGTVF